MALASRRRHGHFAETMVSPLVLALLLSAQAGGDPDDTASTPPTTPPTAAPVQDAETRDLQTLQRLEAHLSVGHELDAAEVEALVAITRSPSPRARALAAAVLPWLAPGVAVGPLRTLAGDPDPRVRATAGQSLVAVSRRLADEDRAVVVATALALLDDENDEVGCAGAELLAALRPPAMGDAFEARAAAASDLRFACYVRFGGLPARPVKLPPAPSLPAEPGDTVDVPGASPTPLPATPREPGWVFIATAAGAGMLVGGALPSALVPARDVLVYDDDFTRLSRQDISFATQAGAAVVGAAALGGGAWWLDETLGLSPDAQAAVFGGAGSGAMLGAGLGFMLDLKGGGPAWLLAGATGAGLVGATAVAALSPVSADDNALALAAASLGGLAGGLGTFAAVPVALTDVGGVGRTDFGFGSVFAAAGLAGLTALAVSPLVEIPAARAAAVSAGGLLGAGVVGGLAFALVPADLETGSRIAAGAGLAGQAAGMSVGALLIPDAWLGLNDEDDDGADAPKTPPSR
jgi:hypothetical protein